MQLLTNDWVELSGGQQGVTCMAMKRQAPVVGATKYLLALHTHGAKYIYIYICVCSMR